MKQIKGLKEKIEEIGELLRVGLDLDDVEVECAKNIIRSELSQPKEVKGGSHDKYIAEKIKQDPSLKKDLEKAEREIIIEQRKYDLKHGIKKVKGKQMKQSKEELLKEFEKKLLRLVDYTKSILDDILQAIKDK